MLGNFSHITVRREKRAIEEFERKNRTTGGVGTLRGWITLKKESEKNRAAAVEDMRRAMEAVKVAEDKVFAIGDRLVEEERQLQVGGSLIDTVRLMMTQKLFWYHLESIFLTQDFFCSAQDKGSGIILH